MTNLTKEQAVIVSGYTGVLICDFADLHCDVERRLGRSVFTHEFANKAFSKEVADLYHDDFIAIAPDPSL